MNTHRPHYTFFLAGIACIFILLPLPSFALQGTTDDSIVDSSEFMQWSAYRNVKELYTDHSTTGAYGPINRNWEDKKDKDKEAKWYIEEQRYGADIIAAGIAHHDTDIIDRGIKILRWGFDQQQQDGGFECPDAFHSTSLFVEAAAHALILLHESEYTGHYITVFKELKPKLQAATRWMLRSDVLTKGKKNNAPYTHRRFLVAAALGETGVYLNNQELIERAEEFAADGIKLQSDSGYNPELGGWDSSYQAVGILYAARYYTIAASAKFRPEMYKMLDKAVKWEVTRILPDGTVDTSDNTRVGAGKKEKGRSGNTKKVDVGKVYQALYYWSRIANDESYKILAQKVAQNAQQWQKPN